MYNIISWYNQNRRRIWVTIIAVVVIGLIVFRLINLSTENNQIEEKEQLKQVDTNTLNSITMSSPKSAISGKTASNSQEKISIIDEFMSYCNSGKIKEAYNLISDECKEEMYPEEKVFQQAYYKPVFGQGRKIVSIENWIGNIYKIDFNEDFLSTGKYTKENTLRDYITIVRDNEDNYKLNINKYIGRTQINKEQTVENIEIKIVKKDTYMDYENYTFEIKNNNEIAIALGDVKNTDASYLTDVNGLKYNAYVHELSQAQLVVTGKQTKTLKIKYFNKYSSTRNIQSLIFPKIILNAEDYVNTDYTRIKFDL